MKQCLYIFVVIACSSFCACSKTVKEDLESYVNESRPKDGGEIDSVVREIINIELEENNIIGPSNSPEEEAQLDAEQRSASECYDDKILFYNGNLNNLDLSQKTFCYTDLSKNSFERTKLRYANLGQSNFRDSHYLFTDFRGANLESVQNFSLLHVFVSGGIFDGETVWPKGLNLEIVENTFLQAKHIAIRVQEDVCSDLLVLIQDQDFTGEVSKVLICSEEVYLPGLDKLPKEINLMLGLLSRFVEIEKNINLGLESVITIQDPEYKQI